MKFSLRWLFLLLLIVSIIFTIIAERYRPVRIAVGMDRATVEKRMKALGAYDYYSVRSVYRVRVPVNNEGETAGKEEMIRPLEDVGPIWNFENHSPTVEISYEDDKLKEIKFWDYRGRDFSKWKSPYTEYIDSGPALEEMEYDLVSEFRVSRVRDSFSYETIKTINAGAYPPKKETR